MSRINQQIDLNSTKKFKFSINRGDDGLFQMMHHHGQEPRAT